MNGMEKKCDACLDCYPVTVMRLGEKAANEIKSLRWRLKELAIIAMQTEAYVNDLELKESIDSALEFLKGKKV